MWSYDTTLDGDPANFHAEVLFAGDLVIVGTDTNKDGWLYAFDPVKGEPRWQLSEPAGFPSDSVKVGTRVVAVTSSGAIRAVNLRSGRVQWSFGGTEELDLLKSSLVVVGSGLLYSLPTGEVGLLNAVSGKSVWRRQLDGRLNSTLAVIGDSFYVGDLNGVIHRLTVKSGKTLGSFQGGSRIYGSLIPAGSCLLALWGWDTLACLDPGLEKVRWSRTVPSKWSSFRVLVHDELVVAGTEDGEIRAMEIETGVVRWSVEVEGIIKGLSVEGEVLYVGTQGGLVYAVRLPKL